MGDNRRKWAEIDVNNRYFCATKFDSYNVSYVSVLFLFLVNIKPCAADVQVKRCRNIDGFMGLCCLHVCYRLARLVVRYLYALVMCDCTDSHVMIQCFLCHEWDWWSNDPARICVTIDLDNGMSPNGRHHIIQLWPIEWMPHFNQIWG